jgi:hypothetical protein
VLAYRRRFQAFSPKCLQDGSGTESQHASVVSTLRGIFRFAQDDIVIRLGVRTHMWLSGSRNSGKVTAFHNNDGEQSRGVIPCGRESARHSEESSR